MKKKGTRVIDIKDFKYKYLELSLQIITDVLANRLKLGLGNILSISKVCIGERKFSIFIFITNECLDRRVRSEMGALFKLDFEKACD